MYTIRGIIEIAYAKGYKSTGRPSYDSLILFKIELLCTWYCFSDGEVEEQVNDRLSFSRFVGLGLEDTAPDSTTVCRFRNTLVEAELYDMVLNEINGKDTCTTYYGGSCIQFLSNSWDYCVQFSQVRGKYIVVPQEFDLQPANGIG